MRADPYASGDPYAQNATHIDWLYGTRADVGGLPVVPVEPASPSGGLPPPPRTWVIDERQPPGTRVFSADMFAASEPSALQVTERFGVRFLSGADSAAALLDDLRRQVGALLLVGDPHSGQRRLARLVARTLARAGAGDGSVRTADGAELRGADAVAATLREAGPLLFERLDTAIMNAEDPRQVAAVVAAARAVENPPSLIATCTPDSYDRLVQRFPDMTRRFDVFRLPDFGHVEARLALIHVLAGERRVTINSSALDVVRADMRRIGGRGDVVGARLVEAYLDRAVARHVERAGVAQVLVPVDFAGIAEELEPSLRPPRDVDGFLRGLAELVGLEEVKRTVGGLVAEARMAADRAVRGLPSGNPSRHLIFLGRPGLGKATVAGLIGGIYAALNLLDSGHLVVCNAREFGEDPAARVAARVERATGGVLLIEDAFLLDRMSAAVNELSRLMAERRDKFLVVCASLPDEMEGFLLANPGFRAEFGAIVEFRELTERQLVQIFTRLAERDLYMLDEELRVELLDLFGGMRRFPGFAFADSVRKLFDQIVARQAARLSGGHAGAAAVARLSVRDLPTSTGDRLLEELHPNRPRRSPG